ncbi:MAG: FAD-dependent oxidoreductase [Burkholderiales bacterium]|nr:FAD-dependent oxidoreductase [Burkholderiales bacterium]
MESFDVVVVGGGVVGTSIACHLAMLGARRVALLERGTLGGGTTAQSSCILRTHYSVREDAELAHAAIGIFARFAEYLEDPEAVSGYNRCGLMIVAPEGARRGAEGDARGRALARHRRARPPDRRGARASSARVVRRHRARRLRARRGLRGRAPRALVVRARRPPSRRVVPRRRERDRPRPRRRRTGHRRAHAGGRATRRRRRLRPEHLVARGRGVDRDRPAAHDLAPRRIHARRARGPTRRTCRC